MIEYEVIDKTEIPDSYIGKWTYLFTHLPMHKSIKLVLPTPKQAENKRRSILSALRYNRKKAHNLDFCLASRIVKLAENEWALFVWKEKKNNGM
ncbi:hypothetical protein ES703_98190 [subsurface metagenome]